MGHFQHSGDCRMSAPLPWGGTQCLPIEIKLTEEEEQRYERDHAHISKLSFNYTNNTQMHAPLSI